MQRENEGIGSQGTKRKRRGKNLLRFRRNYPLGISLHPVFQIVEADDRRLRAFQQMKLKTRHSLRQSGICGKVGWNGTTPEAEKGCARFFGEHVIINHF